MRKNAVAEGEMEGSNKHRTLNLIWSEVLIWRTEGVVCCIDCQAPWGKLVILGYINKCALTWLLLPTNPKFIDICYYLSDTLLIFFWIFYKYFTKHFGIFYSFFSDILLIFGPVLKQLCPHISNNTLYWLSDVLWLNNQLHWLCWPLFFVNGILLFMTCILFAKQNKWPAMWLGVI